MHDAVFPTPRVLRAIHVDEIGLANFRQPRPVPSIVAFGSDRRFSRVVKRAAKLKTDYA
jgi:hypothetical protein